MILDLYLYFSLLLAVLYAAFFILYIRFWRVLPVFEMPNNFEPTVAISVLIPARNEEDTILPCLHSILANNFPAHLLEIIVIDDHSTDATSARVLSLKHANIRLLDLSQHVQLSENQAFKKRAIEIAIKESRGTLIVTTDADCLIPPQWLRLLAAFYEQENKRFIAAPVNFYGEKNLLEKFQSLDYVGMMGITGAGVAGRFLSMCNGANLAYEKKLFYEVGGFRGIDHVASGDDMLLMQKVARYFPDTIGFLKNVGATVLTNAKPTIQDFLSQRQRWASKSSSYTEGGTVFQLACVFLFCLNIFVSLCLSIFYGKKIAFVFFFSLIVKIVSDYILLSQSTRFFNRRDLMQVFLPAQFLHIGYIIIVGILSNFKKKYVWKGRVVR